MGENKITTFWDDELAVPGEKNQTTTWYRSMGLGKFVKQVRDTGGEILGVIVEEDSNNIGFILKAKEE